MMMTTRMCFIIVTILHVYDEQESIDMYSPIVFVKLRRLLK